MDHSVTAASDPAGFSYWDMVDPGGVVPVVAVPFRRCVFAAAGAPPTTSSRSTPAFRIVGTGSTHWHLLEEVLAELTHPAGNPLRSQHDKAARASEGGPLGYR